MACTKGTCTAISPVTVTILPTPTTYRATRSDFVEDNFGNIWFGTFTGLNKYNPTSNQFEVYARNPLPGSMTHSSVFPVYKDRQGTIWLGTYYGGVNYFNPETDIFTVYAANNSRNDCLNYPFVGNMVEDKDNNIWICTEGGGLNFSTGKRRNSPTSWPMRIVTPLLITT